MQRVTFHKTFTGLQLLEFEEINKNRNIKNEKENK